MYSLAFALCRSYLKMRLWWVGFTVFMVGELFNFASMSFASQTLLAVLGCFSPLSNVFMAPCLLGEAITRADLLALPLIVGGAVLVVLYSDHKSQVRAGICVWVRACVCVYLCTA